MEIEADEHKLTLFVCCAEFACCGCCAAGPWRQDEQETEADEPALSGSRATPQPRGGGLQDGHQKPQDQAERSGETAL